MALINLDSQLYDENHDPLFENIIDPVEQKIIGRRSLFAKTLAARSLYSELPNEGIPAEEKAKSFELADRIFKGGDIEMDAKEITKVLERAAKTFGPLVYGQLERLLKI